jgi:hypothetical protein
MSSLNPWRKRKHPLARLRGELEATLDRFFRDWPAAFDLESGPDRLWSLEIEDRGNGIVVRAEVCRLRGEPAENQISRDAPAIRAETDQPIRRAAP